MTAGGEARWTPAQRDAIYLRGRNLLVSAAAGAGKTSVLVERVIQRILDPHDPVDIDRLLVVTFTEAAAAEMRDRIRDRLERAIAERPADRRLRRQLALLGRASISTLHSFCLRVVRQYFFRLGLDPAMRVLSEHEAHLLEQEVLEELFERRYAEADEGFLGLVECYGGRADERLRELVLHLHRLAYSQPWPEAWLERLAGRFSDTRERPVEESPWFVPARQALGRYLDRLALRLERAAALCRRPGWPAELEPLLEQDAARLRDLARRLDDLDWDGIVRELAAANTWGRMPSLRGLDEAQKARKEQVQRLRDGVKGRLRELVEGIFGRPAADVAADAARLAPLAGALVELVQDFDRALTSAKQERGLLDFSDMERYALRLLLDPAARPGELRPSDVAREFRRRFDEVLVDEYQDINQVQDAILRLVAREGSDGDPNLFMVGDVKQSIYRFRQAEPGLFLAKYHAFAPARDPAGSRAEAPGTRIELNANFRSRPSVVHAVNFVFRQIMTPALGGLAYDESAALVPAAGYPPPDGDLAATAGEAPVEVHLIEREPAGESDEDEPAPGGGPAPGGSDEGEPGPAGGEGDEEGSVDTTSLEREAAVVAWRIRELVEGAGGRPPLHVWDKREGRYRPVRYRDIVILMRAVHSQAPVFVEVLARLGIPVYARSRTGYFQALEIEVMLALLRLIDNPRQDVPLASVLRSPLVGLTAAELAAIRLAAPGADYYTAVCTAAGWDLEREEPAEGDEPAGGSTGDDAGPAPGVEETGRAAAANPAGTNSPGVSPSGTAGDGAGGGDGGAGGDGARGSDAAGGSDAAIPASLRERLRRFLSDLQRWRTLARRAPLSRLIEQIYAETGFPAYAAGMPGGEQRRANLEALLERARQFDQFARQGLFRFLRFIDRLRERGDDMGIAPALGEDDDVVRVMTIHQSKGLEFPVVIVANLGGAFAQDKGDAVIDRELGLGLKVADPELRVRYPSLSYWAVKEEARLADLAEELRVLYVAMTRARERLILVGAARDLPGRAAEWLAAAPGDGGPLPAAVLAGAASYLDWLGPALVHHPDAEPLRRLAAGEPLAAVTGAAGAGYGEAPAAGRGGGSAGDAAGEHGQRLPGAAGESSSGAAGKGGGDAGRGTGTGRSEEPAGSGDPSRWLVRVWAREEVERLLPQEAGTAADPLWRRIEAGEPLDRPASTAAVAELRRRLEWRYPYAELVNHFAKRSVTELKGPADPERQEFPLPHELRLAARRPRFLAGAQPAAGDGGTGGSPRAAASGAAAAAASGTGTRLPAVDRGVATHLVLRHLDLAGPLDEEGVRAQIAALAGRELLTQEQAAAVDAAALARFFASPLGHRLREDPARVRREWMFTLGLPASEVYPDLPPDVAGGEIVVVQGVIDCFVEEEDGLLLLDFKTDEPAGRPLEEMARRYHTQVRLYRRALEEITGRPVREAYLYFLAVGEAVRVP
ncbi:MAG TPA: UvrD-helicase domain-containing protein [Thermaerobacter sp.]